MKNGIYFTGKSKDNKNRDEGAPDLRRKGIVTALIYVAVTIGGIAVFLAVRTKGEENLVFLLLAMAAMVTCVEVYFANPQKKSYSLLKKIFYKQ